MTYDVAVIGLGIAGTSILNTLAEKGKKVIGIDQFDLPNNFGSSHGDTRITRKAPFEGDTYYHMIQKTFPLWKELEKKTGQQLYFDVGGLDISSEDDEHFQTSLNICKKYNLEYEILDADEIQKRFPAYHLPPHLKAIYNKESGFIMAERSWRAFLESSKSNNAEILTSSKVDHIDWDKDGVSIKLKDQTIRAENVILSQGSWIEQFCPFLKPNIKIIRQTLSWFDVTNPDLFQPNKFPIFAMNLDGVCHFGLPIVNEMGFKTAIHYHFSEEVSPDHVPPITEKDEKFVEEKIKPYFPDMKKVNTSTTCKYTCVDDHNFIIDKHPDSNRVHIFSCCSGHGFKYAPIYGPMAYDWLYSEKSEFDFDVFSLKRLL